MSLPHPVSQGALELRGMPEHTSGRRPAQAHDESAPRLRIAYFVSEFPSISETFVRQQITAALAAGHHVDVYARYRGSSLSERAAAETGELVPHRVTYDEALPASITRRLLGACFRLARWGSHDPSVALECLRGGHPVYNSRTSQIQDYMPPADFKVTKYDVIHCHFGPNGQRALAWRKCGAIKGPIITTFHGFDANALPKIYGEKLYRALFKDVDCVTIGSTFMRNRVIALGASASKLTMLPMGVDLSKFDRADRHPPQDGRLRLLTVARLVEVKGIEYALRAMAIARRAYPNIAYQVAGDGPLRPKLQALAKELGVADIVTFSGACNHDQVAELHRQADLFILPSIVTEAGEEENQSVALIEAQASSLPVIATMIGGNAESILNGVSGVLVPQRDPEALAGAVLHLAKDPAVWAEMGRAGRQHVLQNYDLSTLNETLLNLYRLLAMGVGS